jgi:hydrogenase maturation protease
VRIHLIGIGTGHGDDAAGLRVAEALAATPLPPGVAVRACARPLPDLLDALEGADAAVIVDAARTGAAPGCVRRLAREDLALARPASSHGLGVAQVLQLAEALGRAPARVELLGVEIGLPVPGAVATTPPVRAAIPAAAAAALALARALQRA